MIRRHVLAALAAGIDAGDEDVARKALRRTDYVLRGMARRALERALVDAALLVMDVDVESGPRRAESASDTTSPDAIRHIQQVAALAIAKQPIDAPQDRERVTAAYRALAIPRPPRFPLATALVTVLALSAGAVVSMYLWTLPVGKAKRAYARPLPPPAAGAFKDGGVPLEDPAIAKLFVDELTSLVIESDRDRQKGGLDKDRKAHSIALIGAPAIATKGPALVHAWAEMLGMLDRWVYVPQSSKEFRDIAREFRHKVRAVSDQLAAVGIGYYLEGDVMERSSGAHALIYTYRVEEVVLLDAGGKPRRVLSLRRLDRLNLTHTLLGMQSTELGDPVLLLDQIDEHVATHVLPVLDPGASYPLGDETYQRYDGAALAKIAGEAVRGELVAAFGPDGAAALKIGALLAERVKLIESWREIMDRKGWILARTDNLFLPEKLIDSVEGDVPNSERDRAHTIEEELARLEAPRIASRCHQLVAATIRRHEAQHGMDDDRPEPLAYPAVLEALLGDPVDEDGEPVRYVERARAELSAYTSQLANDLVTPQVSLWNVAKFAFNEGAWGTPEAYSGVLIVEGLARHLKIASPGPVIHDRTIDRARLAALITPMATMSGDQLRTAARALWRELYREDIIAIVER